MTEAWTAAPARWRLAPVPQAPRWIGDTPGERVASIVADDRRWAAALRWTLRRSRLRTLAHWCGVGVVLLHVQDGVARAREPLRTLIWLGPQ